MTLENMLKQIKEKGRPLADFKKGDKIHVNNKMQKGYSYTLSEDPGTNLGFKPYASPGEMLALGVFEGKYMNDCIGEYPNEWFINAIALGKLSPGKADPSVNAFGVKSRQNLDVWQENGWVAGGGKGKKTKRNEILSDPTKNPDERGWFQFYCRYWMGRRIPELDEIQIARWNAFTRHAGQIKKNCKPGDLECYKKSRMGLLQWSHDPFI